MHIIGIKKTDFLISKTILINLRSEETIFAFFNFCELITYQQAVENLLKTRDRNITTSFDN